MPFFRESFDNDDVRPPAADMAPRPVSPSRQPKHTPLSGILNHRLSEESIRTELCEGPVPDPLISEQRLPGPGLDMSISDRSELIERLKRGESPTWIPHPRNGSHDCSSKPQQELDDAKERLEEGLTIERPRSALHSGDFTQDEAGKQHLHDYRLDGDEHAASWLATSPPRDFVAPFRFERRIPFPDLPDGYRSSPPSLSSSLSSTLYRHPTSPLVHSESNDDLSINSMNLDPETPTRRPRMQTTATTAGHRMVPPMLRESTFPYQAHQPRKSLTSVPTTFSYMPGSSPQSIPRAAVSSRRPSIALESSPLQRTSLVGSYEESILRGRMSTTPSKPFDFLAQIGVLGLGANCKSSLRCPAHVTLPFPAVFYSYGSSTSAPGHGDDGPSPYVGQIDLENGLSSNTDAAGRRRRNSRQRSGSAPRRPTRAADGDGDVDMAEGLDMMTLDAREVAKHQRRRRHNANTSTNSGSSTANTLKAPPGGSYRIPEKGQLQIIIKNHNKTAVKLFLVPYDLEGMQPGTKTFIRQRSYSSGPIIPGTKNENDKEEHENPAAAAADDKPVLRYLAHLHICCPARGRYYLYRSIRVVFANRVPDGKEKLRNEITLPEPRFTPYKAVRQMVPPLLPCSTTSSLSAAEKASRRRSLGFSFGARCPSVRAPPPPPPPPPPMPVPEFEVRARALSVQDLGGRRPVVSTVSVGGGSHFPISSGVAAGAESLLSQRLRSLGMQGGGGGGRGEMELDDSEQIEGST